MWVNVTNASVSSDGKILTKTSTCDGCPDAGAKSQQQIVGDGAAQFTVADSARLRFFALSSSATDLNQLDFAWRVEAGYAEVRENGDYQEGISVTSSDVLKIAVEGGVVKYYKNTTLIHTSDAETIPQPLFASAALLALSSAINDARIESSSSGGGGGDTFLCGLENDTRVLIPANYDTFVPPARGQTYVDAPFNCTVKRISDGLAQFNDVVRHAYATMSPFNSNSTRLLLQTSSQQFVTDLNGTIIVDPITLNIGTNSEALWSTTDPDLIYYPYLNEIRSYNISTGVRSTLATFPHFNNMSFGLGEADLSDDGRYVVVVEKTASYQAKSIQVFDFSSRTLSPGLAIPEGVNLDWCDMTANNNVLCQWVADGTGRFQGLELFTNQMVFIRQVVSFHGHSDRARDTNGDEVILMEASVDPAPPAGCEGNGFEKIRLADSVKTCLLPTHWSDAAHASVNGPNGFAVIGGVHLPTGASPAPFDWETQWRQRYNEIGVVSLDGSKVLRLVHHRSRVFASSSYYYTPRAAVSRDGRYVLFDSNYNSNPMTEYADVYLIQIKQ